MKWYGWLAGAMLFAKASMAAAPESFAPIIEPLMPAVVNISTTQKIVEQAAPFLPMPGMTNDPQLNELLRQFGEQFSGGAESEREVSSLGSGFIISADGLVVTNNHVIGTADAVTVILPNNTHLPAKIMGRDPKTDLALLKVTSDKPLPYVKLGDSDAMKVGDWVIAVGNPFGLGGSVSAGIVSARGRNINAGPFDDFIQTDAAINRGNSGGPLFNAKGEVVGINSAIFSPTGGNIGIGFAVPTALAKPVLDQLKQFGKTHRAWLGVKIQEVNEEVANSIGLDTPRGAMVLEISPKSPAASSGIAVGDVIVGFDGQAIDQMRTLPRTVANTKVGKKVEVTVFRKGREQRYTLTLVEQEDDTPPARHADASKPIPGQEYAGEVVLGMKLADINAPLRRQFGIPDSITGLLVVAVDRKGVAAKQGVQVGDVVREVNQTQVNRAHDATALAQAAKKSGRKFVLLRVQRGKSLKFVTLPVE